MSTLTHQRSRGAARAWPSIALAVLAVVATATWARASSDETLNSTNPATTAVNVNPSDGLAERHTVRVSARGLHANASVQILQCSPAPFPSVANADCEQRAAITTDRTGAFSNLEVVVFRVIRPNPNRTIDCRAPNTCGLYATTRPSGAARLVGHHLSFFVPGAPAPPPGPAPPAPSPPAPAAAPRAPAAPRTVVVSPGGAPAAAPSGDAPPAVQEGPAAPGAAAGPPVVVAPEIGGPAPVAGGPSAEVRPASVQPGQHVVVTGAGFGAVQTLDVTLLSAPVGLGSGLSDGVGEYRLAVRIPSDASPGDHDIVVSSGEARAVARITVERPAGRASPSAKSSTGSSPLLLPVIGAVLLAMGRMSMIQRRRQQHGW